MKKPVPAQKKCPRCGEVKPASGFYRRQNGSLNSPCIECCLGHPPPKKGSGEGFKACNRCGVEKPVEEFRLHYGRRINPCKACVREYYKAWGKANPEKRKEITARTFDPARAGERRRAWEAGNRQAHAEGLLPIPEEKLCSKCGQVKPREEFYVSWSQKTGLTSQCKNCICTTRLEKQ